METINDLIKFFESIPKDKWCVGYLECAGKRCALGHLNFHLGKDEMSVKRNLVLSATGTLILLGHLRIPVSDLVDANDMPRKNWGDHPKDRTISFLKEKLKKECLKR